MSSPKGPPFDKFATFVGERRLHNFLTLDEYRYTNGKVTYIITKKKIIIKGRYSPKHTIRL